VNPGFGGQTFLPGAVEKIAQLSRAKSGYTRQFRIEVDGGIGADTVPTVVRAGAEILVAGTSIFHTADPAAAMRELQRLASEAVMQRA